MITFNSPHTSKPQSTKGKPSEVTLDNIYSHLNSVEKKRDRENKIELISIIEKKMLKKLLGFKIEL